MLVWSGEVPDTQERLDADVWFDLVVAAADAFGVEDGIVSIGGGPANELVAVHPEMAGRFHEARSSHPGLEVMFRAMQAYCLRMGDADAGWWSDRPADSN
jgi:hypothetical protein